MPKSERAAKKKSVKDALLVSENSGDDDEIKINRTNNEMAPEVARSNETTDSPTAATHKARKGHRKNPDRNRRLFRIEKRAKQAILLLEKLGTADEMIVDVIPLDAKIEGPEALDAHAHFMGYIGKRIVQIKYSEMQSRGLQIGSGSMESLHKSASQVRLKRSGVTCLAETSQAIQNWRMLRLSGRWEEFWVQPDLAKKMAAKWTEPAPNPKSAMAA